MDKLIVVVFDNEVDAFNGISALKDLHSEGTITLFSQTVIQKSMDGEISVKEEQDQGPIGTLFGMATGSLIGLLGGPIGFMIGTTSGALAGMIYDLNAAGVDADFVDDVSEALVTDTTAIIAEVDEDWTVPIDTKMFESNGIVFRRLRSEVEDEQLQREATLSKENWENFKTNLKESHKETQENINKHIDMAKKKMNTLENHIEKRMNALTKEFNEKLKTLQEQLKGANEKMHEQIDEKINTLKVKHEKRMAKLKSIIVILKS